MVDVPRHRAQWRTGKSRCVADGRTGAPGHRQPLATGRFGVPRPGQINRCRWHVV